VLNRRGCGCSAALSASWQKIFKAQLPVEARQSRYKGQSRPLKTKNAEQKNKKKASGNGCGRYAAEAAHLFGQTI
jgi:hypothetical protein